MLEQIKLLLNKEESPIVTQQLVKNISKIFQIKTVNK